MAGGGPGASAAHRCSTPAAAATAEAHPGVAPAAAVAAAAVGNLGVDGDDDEDDDEMDKDAVEEAILRADATSVNPNTSLMWRLCARAITARIK